MAQYRKGSGSGGGHGGDGADSKYLGSTNTAFFSGYPSGGEAHGSAVSPWAFGSGGGGYCNAEYSEANSGCPLSTSGGSGGGRISLVAGSVLTLSDGATVSANGNDGSTYSGTTWADNNAFTVGSGGGAGGSIALRAFGDLVMSNS